MKFGSDENFAYVKEMVTSGDYDKYETFWRDTGKDVEILIRSFCHGISQDKLDEISQTVLVKVISGLPNFCKNSEHNPPAMRNKWLVTIVDHERRTYFNKDKPTEEYDDTSTQGFAVDPVELVEQRTLIFEALRSIFQTRTTADKLLAFVYNRLLDKLPGENGSPKFVVDTFKDVPLITMYNCMVSNLSDILQCPVPDNVLEPLKVKVDKCPNAPFSLSDKVISDSSSWISKKWRV